MTDIYWFETDPFQSFHLAKQKRFAELKEVLDLSMVNPDLPPPRFALDKLMEAITNPKNHRYAVSRGVRKTREAFATKYKNRFAISLDADTEVCVTMGTKDAIAQILISGLEKGSKVLLGCPFYPPHISAIKYAGLTYELFEISPDENLMLERIRGKIETAQVSALLLNFPNNPTGCSVTQEFYSRLFPLLQEKKVRLINDFVYGEMGYDSTPISCLSVGHQGGSGLVETYSLSKAYSVPGWRVGAVVGDSKWIKKISLLKSEMDYGLFLPVQIAAGALLSSGEDLVKPNLLKYKRRAEVLVRLLKDLGWDVSEPTAGACVWAALPVSVGSATKFCEFLLEKYGIALYPGAFFGEATDRYVRYALVKEEPELREAFIRIKDAVRLYAKSQN